MGGGGRGGGKRGRVVGVAGSAEGKKRWAENRRSGARQGRVDRRKKSVIKVGEVAGK